MDIGLPQYMILVVFLLGATAYAVVKPYWVSPEKNADRPMLVGKRPDPVTQSADPAR